MLDTGRKATIEERQHPSRSSEADHGKSQHWPIEIKITYGTHLSSIAEATKYVLMIAPPTSLNVTLYSTSSDMQSAVEDGQTLEDSSQALKERAPPGKTLGFLNAPLKRFWIVFLAGNANFRISSR